jgi:hypothetical protein
MWVIGGMYNMVHLLVGTHDPHETKKQKEQKISNNKQTTLNNINCCESTINKKDSRFSTIFVSMEPSSSFYLNTHHAATDVASAPSSLAVPLPQWVVDFHQFRKSLFLRTVEPIIEYLLGPAQDEQETYVSQDFPNDRRRLGLLPHYVQDINVYRETSMSFATLVMLFTIMTCVLLIFLSCFYHNQKTSPLFASPRRHRLPKLVPPPLPVDGTFSWIKVCFYMSDEEVGKNNCKKGHFIGLSGFMCFHFVSIYLFSIMCYLFLN